VKARLRFGLALVAALAATSAFAPVSAGAATTLPTGFQEQTLDTDFNAPGESAIVDVAWAPDGHMFVADRAGMVFVQNPGAQAGDHTLLLNISDHVNNGPATDRGLLGIALDKNFASNGWLYLLYTYDKDTTDDNGWQVSTLTRVTVNPITYTVVGGTNSPTETRILGEIPSSFGTDPNVGVCGAPSNTNQCIPSEGESHSIGTVRVDPSDGTLWVGTGDGNDYTIVDPLAFNDNNPETYRGKIMHIGTDGEGLPGHPFCPDDGTLTDVCTKIYAEGLRNPFRFTVRPSGGLAIGDVGENAWEEFDLASGGEDFGWPCWEGNGHTTTAHPYANTDYCKARYADTADTPTPPTFAWAHVPYLSTGPDRTQCSVGGLRGNTSIGGPTYMGDQYPAGYRGTIFFADYMCQWINRATVGGGAPTWQPFASDWENGVDLESAPDGNLVYIADNEVREVVYGPGNHRPVVAPSASPTDGSAPLAVAFDAHGSDPDSDPLTYDWDFGDGSAHGAGAAPSHQYTDAGSYTATVTADDGRGMTDSATVAIDVTAPSTATSTPTPTSTPAPPPAGNGTKSRQPLARLLLSGTSARFAGPGRVDGSFGSRKSVRKLDISLWSTHSSAVKRCSWWSRRSHSLKHGSCEQPHWMFATLHRHGSHYTWKLSLGGSLPRGSYTLVIQAVPRSSALAPSARLQKTLRVR
jgi:glucose/arabinose dehydrogenase